MSTIRNPVGPQPPGVYWKRRAMVLLGLVAIIIVIVLIVVRPGGGTPTSTATSPSPSVTSTSSGDGDDEAPDCDLGDIELIAVLDKTAYSADELPQVSMSITNTGGEACTIGVGTDLQVYRIASGSDPIWDSRDCQESEAAAETVLQPGVPKSTNPIPWDRTRSSTETCDGDRPEMPAGDKTYSLTVELGELESEAVRFRLL